MTLISLEDAKAFLRVDSADEDMLIGSLLTAAASLCTDVARLTPEQWAQIDSDAAISEHYGEMELAAVRATIRVAVLYTLGYLYEHREEADHHALTLTLRALLFGIREEGAV